ncbi:MAG: UvrD-helicase domain-containing protein [Magnetococcus sp. WYHC-3]
MNDAWARQRALDPGASFIVRAPAGSGKTGLLTQRILRLLTVMEHPGELVAITFTRKAAAEMRHRVLAALASASGPQPQAPHEALTWALARDALPQAQRWGLLEQPTRLRIRTIDALCGWLTRRLPVVAQLGAPPHIADDCDALVQEAARATLRPREPVAAAHREALEILLDHLDWDRGRAISLLTSLLHRRDQWLRHVVPFWSAEGASWDALRRAMDIVLEEILLEELAPLAQAVPRARREEILELGRGAAGRLPPERNHLPLAALADAAGFPQARLEDIPLWEAVANLLLTSGGDYRKPRGLNVNLGFPPTQREDKARMAALLDALQREAPELPTLLGRLALLPPRSHSDEQWRVMQALFRVLRTAVLELLGVFRTRGQVDHVEVARRALLALGDAEDPTDLAFQLDGSLRHLLVDEFQDTSRGQFELLTRLTARWSPQGGQTLFLVGDPMQSIYRFREAEVGLFARAQRHGVGGMMLESLELQVNFRSCPGLVAWCNRVFPDLMPAGEAARGAGGVVFEPAQAVLPEQAEPAVLWHGDVGTRASASQREAQAVVARVQSVRAAHPGESIAILVRGRPHLAAIAPALRAAGIPLLALDIDPLARRAGVRDLLTLTRALLDPCDRIHWLALLRAPWCALTRAELVQVAGDGVPGTLIRRLEDPLLLAALAPAVARRVTHLTAVVRTAWAERRRLPLRRWVAGAWVALGGPATLSRPGDLEDAESFLAALEPLERAGDLVDPGRLETALARLYAAPDASGDNPVHLMTIHKAKGLEFHHVLLPGLHRGGQRDATGLLAWMERPEAPPGRGLLLALRARSDSAQADTVHRYLLKEEQRRSDQELVRLLYVAATRARRQLHLFASLEEPRRGDGDLHEAAPRLGSFLHLLWRSCAEEFHRHVPEPALTPLGEGGGPSPHQVPLWSLAPSWCPPPPPPALEGREQALSPSGEDATLATPDFLWAGAAIRQEGVVIHRWLRRLAQDGLETWPPQRVAGLGGVVAAQLADAGVPPDLLAASVGHVLAALQNTLGDPTGRWILSASTGAACEFELAAVIAGECRHLVMDRTFVDQGVRWIIDYKSGTHGGGGLEAFLDAEVQRYRGQLSRYAQAMAAWQRSRGEQSTLRVGLYYPRLAVLRHWDPSQA